MTCDAIRNRLLALPDLSRPTDDLRAHLTTCEPCTAWLARATDLDRAVANLPAPDSAEALRGVRRLPERRRAGHPIHSADRPAGFSLVALGKRVDWRVVSGLAAVVLISVGIWAFSGDSKPAPEVAGPKDEPLARGVDFVTAMGKALDAAGTG